MSSIITLNCFYWPPRHRDRTFSSCRSIKLSPDSTIDDCKVAILNKTRSGAFPADAELYTLPENHPVPIKNGKDTLGSLSISDLGEELLFSLSLLEIFESQPDKNYLHLILVDRGIPLRVGCWIHGTDHKDVFLVDVQGDDTLQSLRPAIAQNHPILQDGNWSLYKTAFSDNKEFSQTADMTEGELLPGFPTQLAFAFNDIPFSKIPYIIVRREIVRSVSKRPLERDFAERYTKAPRLHNWAPSKTGAPEYRILQHEEKDRLLDYRTFKSQDGDKLPDVYLPPIEILFDGFGEFLQIYRAGYRRSSDVVVVNPQMQAKVDRFADNMSQIYHTEIARFEEGRASLNDIFCGGKQLIVPSEVLSTPLSAGLQPRSNGRCLFGKHHIPGFIVEFKNEAECDVPPIIELVGYYSRLVQRVVVNHPDVARRSLFPVLGVTIAGPAVTFYGLAHVGWVVYVPLSTSMMCLPVECGGSDRFQLYVAFQAAYALFKSIENDAGRFDSGSPSTVPEITNPFFPQFNKLPGLTSTDPPVEFTITGFLAKHLSRHVYRATSSDGDLVIKLTRSYSAALHEYCFELGYAPKLLSMKRFPGGIFAIAMKYVEGDLLSSLPLRITASRSDEWIRNLEGIVAAIHKKELVHGDLRPPNIVCVEDKLFLLDFDWGGKVGEARYPSSSLNATLTEGRDMSSLEITKEDDGRALRATLDYIRNNLTE